VLAEHLRREDASACLVELDEHDVLLAPPHLRVSR